VYGEILEDHAVAGEIGGAWALFCAGIGAPESEVGECTRNWVSEQPLHGAVISIISSLAIRKVTGCVKAPTVVDREWKGRAATATIGYQNGRNGTAFLLICAGTFPH